MSDDEPKVFTLEGKPLHITEPAGEPVSAAVIPLDTDTKPFAVEAEDSLRDALALVRTGKLTGLGMILVLDDGDIDTVQIGKRLVLLSGAARLMHRINQVCDNYMILGGGVRHAPPPMPDDNDGTNEGDDEPA